MRKREKSGTAVNTFEDCLANATPAQHAALQRVRAVIHTTVPEAEECVGYGVAAFRLQGKLLAGIAACQGYCSYYPMSGKTIVTLRKKLAGFETTSGSIHFTPAKPLSAALVRELVKTRIAEFAARPGRGSKRAPKGRLPPRAESKTRG